jgi:hypothetical protein
MAAASAERVDGDEHARTGGEAARDRVAQADVDVVAGSDVATVVKPAISVRRANSAARSVDSGTVRRRPATASAFQSSDDSSVTCVCASMKPGRMVASPRSITCAPAGTGSRDPAVVIRAPCTSTTASGMAVSPRPSNSRAALIAITPDGACADVSAAAATNAATIAIAVVRFITRPPRGIGYLARRIIPPCAGATSSSSHSCWRRPRSRRSRWIG